MSVLYPDLNNTTFPESIDTFLTYLDITASDGKLVQQYMDAMNAGNQAQANDILAQIPAANQKIIKATDLNKLTQAMLAVERFYKTDVEPFIENKQKEWLTILNQFNYIGTWSSGTSYQKNNMVTYIVGNITLLYLATAENVPVGTPPTNSNYWRVLTIQGQQGASGRGLSYRQNWKQVENYVADDAVTHNGIIWLSLKNNTGIEPGTDSTAWKEVVRLDVTTYPIQPNQPSGQSEGNLWFNTQTDPTKYYQLNPLTTPATSSQIVTGYEAYNEIGEKIVGTFETTAQYATISNETKKAIGLDELSTSDDVFKKMSEDSFTLKEKVVVLSDILLDNELITQEQYDAIVK